MNLVDCYDYYVADGGRCFLKKYRGHGFFSYVPVSLDTFTEWAAREEREMPREVF